jgi:hypothetical protein
VVVPFCVNFWPTKEQPLHLNVSQAAFCTVLSIH